MAFLAMLQVVTCAALAPLLLICDLREVPAPVWRLLAVTGCVHGLYSFWLARGYTLGDLALVYPISRSAPAFVPLAAVPLLGESVSLGGALGIALVVAGIWLVQAGSALRLRRLLARDAVFAYLTLAATVAYSLVDKQAMKLLSDAPWSGPYPRSVLYFTLISIAHAPIFLGLGWRHLERGALRAVASEQRAALAGSAIAGFASYGLILEALQTASVSYVVAARQMSVVFALGLAIVWLGERPTRGRVLGALATVVGVVVIALAG